MLADCRLLPFKNNSFQRVFAGDVIEHLDYNDSIKMLHEAFRVLKPVGFVLTHTAPNTIFTKIVYPLGCPILRLIDKECVSAVDDQLRVGKRVHVYEHNYFSLKKIMKVAELKRGRVWIDDDILRSGKHRLTKDLKNNIFIKALKKLGKLKFVRLIFGNDLYLKCFK